MKVRPGGSAVNAVARSIQRAVLGNLALSPTLQLREDLQLPFPWLHTRQKEEATWRLEPSCLPAG